MRRQLAVLLGLMVCALQTGAAQQGVLPPNAAPPAQIARAAAHAPDVLLVGFYPDAPPASRAAARATTGAVSFEPLSARTPHAEKLHLPRGRSVEDAIKSLAANPAIRYAEPDYEVRHTQTSNDPYYTGGSLWGMYGDQTTPANQFGSQAGEAWAAGRTGSSAVYVGIIDEGIDTSHPDLAANIWINPFEVAGNGVDDDGNGYVDDVNGWDFANNDSGVYNPGGDAHGTHVAGTIGGRGGNGFGVAGVNWDVTLISAKFLGSGGTGLTSDAIRAVDYLTDLKTRHGLDIVASNNSWGGGGFSQALLDAINRGGDAGILFVAAAGNGSADLDAGVWYPADYQCTNGGSRGWDCVVSVASITSTGALSSFSNYGSTNVDLGAPGSDIWSTVPGGSLASFSGTSMATPHVTGAVALCASIGPLLSSMELRSALLSSVTATSSLVGKTATGGRLNVGAMASACLPSTQPVNGTPSGLTATATSATSTRLDWSDTLTYESSYEIQRAPGLCSGTPTFATVGWAGANAVTYTDQGLQSSSAYCYRVRGTNTYPPTGSASPWSPSAGATTLAPPPGYVAEPVGFAWVDVTSGGTQLALTDDSSAAVTLPFSFSFYGTPTTNIAVSSNGFLRFTAGTANQLGNMTIPNSSEPNGIVAPFWDDLNPSAGGGVWTRTVGTAPNRQFVVGWVNVPQFGVVGSAISFEVVLEEAGGGITFQYQDTVVGNAFYDLGASATVGIEDAQGTSGTLFSFNTPSLQNGTAYRFAQSAGPTLPAVSVGNASVPEGNSGTTNASFTLSLSAPSTQSVSVNYGTANGSAGAPGDYAATSGTYTFAPGTTSGAISVAVVGDTALEGNETFTMTLSAPVNATLGTAQASGTIINDDVAPPPTSSLSIADVSQVEGQSGSASATFTVTLAPAGASQATVNFATSNGTATAGSDYTAVSGSLNFAPGVTTQTVLVPVAGDTTVEVDETFAVTLSGATNATIGDAQGIGTIVNDDVSQSGLVAAYSFDAGSGTTLGDQSGTGNHGSINGATWATGHTGGALAFNGTSNWVTVADAASLDLTTGMTLEAWAFPTAIAGWRTVVLKETTGDMVYTLYANDDGTRPGTWVRAGGTLSWTLGTSQLPLNVWTHLAATYDATTLRLFVNGVQVSAQARTGPIEVSTGALRLGGNSVWGEYFQGRLDDVRLYNRALSAADIQTDMNTPVGGGMPALAITDVTVSEGHSGTTNAVFAVSLGASSQAVTVAYATSNGTATAGSDYAVRSGTLSFAASATGSTQAVTVPVTGDTTVELNETFTVTLSNPTNATIADGQGVGTIVDDDTAPPTVPPTLSINDVLVSEGDAGTTTATFTVTMNVPSSQTVSVNLSTSNGTATAGQDYTSTSVTLIFPTGTTSQTASVSVLGDTVDEVDETFRVNLSDPVNATVTDSQGIATITDNDPAPSIRINDTSVAEGDSGTTSAIFTVTLSTASSRTVAVNYATERGTARSGRDYEETSGTVTFNPGVTTRTVAISVNGDKANESAETFFVNLSGASNATIADGQGIGTIADDD